MDERYHLLKAFAKYLNSHLGVEHPHTFKAKIKHLKWICGYLGVSLATNVASEEILLDTTVLNEPDNKTKLAHSMKFNKV